MWRKRAKKDDEKSENSRKKVQNLLTNEKKNAILIKHKEITEIHLYEIMPEWRNWQTPGT